MGRAPSIADVKQRVWGDTLLIVRGADGQSRLFEGKPRDVRQTEYGIEVVTRREWGLKDPEDWAGGADAMPENPDNWYEQEASTVFYPWHRVGAIETDHAFEEVTWD